MSERSERVSGSAQPTEIGIAANAIGRRFGPRWVLRGATLEVRRGEAVGLLGANGSGKSTLLRILATLLTPNAGSALVNGFDVVRDASRVRDDVGYLAHTPGLYDDLTARENLEFAADMLGVSRALVDAVLERAGLTSVADDRTRGFSAGMQRRVAVARLMMRTSRVLLLDEPYSNLDEQGIAVMNSFLRDTLNAGGTALIALHELTPAKSIMTRTVTLVDGRVAARDEAKAPGRAASMAEIRS